MYVLHTIESLYNIMQYDLRDVASIHGGPPCLQEICPLCLTIGVDETPCLLLDFLEHFCFEGRKESAKIPIN